MLRHLVGSLGLFLGAAPAVAVSLVWHTFLGGADLDRVQRVVVDESGNVYVAGNSEDGWGSPVRAYSAEADAFVAKLDASGNVIWVTFLGGSGDDVDGGIGLGPGGRICVNGASNASWGSPVRPYSASFDQFVAHLDAETGDLLWNTFLGSEGTETGSGCVIDALGHTYVAGSSAAPWGSPVRAFTGSEDDAFVAKLDGNGAVLWNTFLGGGADDGGRGISVDGSGHVVVSGFSGSSWASPVRAHSAGFDGFVARLDGDGALLWNAFLGGTGSDFVGSNSRDGSGGVYVAGASDATWGAPLRAFGADFDAFAARLDEASGTLEWSTFLGSGLEDRGSGVAVGGEGDVFVSGYSRDTWGTPLRPHEPFSLDGFVARLDAAGNLIANTFLGGDSQDVAERIAADAGGHVYVTGFSDDTWGTPLLGFQDPRDGFVAKLSVAPPVPDGPYLTSDEIPGFRFKVRITGGTQVAGKQETDCLGETLCVSGALAGRSELFVRIIGPRPNGFLWLNLVRFTTSQVEVWAEQIETEIVNYYSLPALPREGTELTGLVDKQAYLESSGLRVGDSEATPRVGRGEEVTFTSQEFPDFEFTVRIFSGDTEQPAKVEADCIDETVCVSGALAGRSELFLRIIGPRPNGFLWLNLVRFTTSRVEVTVEQLSTGETQEYVLDAVPRESNQLPGLVDKEAFEP